nr:hypothetical protein [Bacteroidota bacterium]
MTINAIVKKMKEVPVERLEELYQIVNSLTPTAAKNETVRKKILSFGGTFSDMSNADYSDYINHTQKTRAKLFDRTTNL